MNAMEKRYSLDEVAEFLGVHYQTVRRWVREGRLRATRHGRRIVFRPEDLREFEARESELLREGVADQLRAVGR